tara:strand:+ start:162 stop:479 length:318 start_codon:yes stop_codon:yes gene_type:complete
MTQTSIKKATKTVVAYVHAGHGVSTANGNEQPIIIATRAAKEAKRTWGRTYKFPKETIFTATVYDVTGVEKWTYNTDSCQVTNDDEIPVNGTRHCNYICRYQIVL